MTPITPAVSGPVWPPDVHLLARAWFRTGFTGPWSWSFGVFFGPTCRTILCSEMQTETRYQFLTKIQTSNPGERVRTQMKSWSHPVRWGKAEIQWTRSMNEALYIKWDTAERCTPNMTWLPTSSGGKWQLRERKQHSQFSNVFKLRRSQVFANGLVKMGQLMTLKMGSWLF